MSVLALLLAATAVITPTGAESLDPAGRDAIASVLRDAGLEVLTKEVDPARADVVVEVSFPGKSCRLNAFVTPTGEKLATVSAENIDKAALALSAKLKPALEKALKEGLPQVLSLRWTKRLDPDPALVAVAFFKQKGIKASSTAAQSRSASFHFKTEKSPAAMKDLLRDYFSARYRITEEPPAKFPSSPRTHMFLLRKK
jgi:hypothetical protein